jgi:hypothetical protein
MSIKNNIKFASTERVMKRVQKILQPVRFLGFAGGGATGSGVGGDEGAE